MGEKTCDSFLKIERKGGKIVSLLTPSTLLSTGGQVVSKGTCLVPKGVRGRVVAIEEPYADGHTTDVVICVFNGHDGPVRMKPGELAEPAPEILQ
ncbi:MAG: hypothetical protein NUV42_01305 [Candidatus Yonathbacteria bacterium]|nr:hypothetical protein [Candidatus Yonathbacteria bacterium]